MPSVLRFFGLLLAGVGAVWNQGSRATAGPLAPPAEAAPAPASASGSMASYRIDIRGAVAHVTATRVLGCPLYKSAPLGEEGATSPAVAQTDIVLDLALPEGSALLEVQVSDGARFEPLKRLDVKQARKAYAEALRALGSSALKDAWDDSQIRIRLACARLNNNNFRTIKYSFSTLLDVFTDGARLVFPASPEPSPPSARVDVRVEGAADLAAVLIGGASHRVGSGVVAIASDSVSMRSRWLVSLVRARTSAQARDAPRLIAWTSVAAPPRGPGMLAYLVAAIPTATAPPPERVLFLVDRSRSVGPAGLEAERDMAQHLLEKLPPSTRFDAVFFDRAQQRLFPVARTATRQAMLALEDEMVPDRLANGTDLQAALRVAGDLLRREADEFSSRTLLVVLSDGAVGEPAARAGLFQVIGPVRSSGLQIAALSLRPKDDPPVSPDERRVLRVLAEGAPAGGVERSLRSDEIRDQVPAILDALRAGGDVAAIAIRSREVSGSFGRGPDNLLVEALAPGAAISGITSLPDNSKGRAALVISHQEPGGRQRKRQTLHPTQVDPAWLRPLLLRTPPAARVLTGPATAVLVEPRAPAASAPLSDANDLPRGYLERSVVRDALSLAFTPRARACYLNRTAKTAADRDLTGRVRLALDLVRGEVGNARIETSSLAHPDIENCLKSAAFALEVPRAYRNDEIVTAVLNLVFRPRNPERAARPEENPAISRELDLIIEGVLRSAAEDSPHAPTPLPPTPPDLPPSNRELGESASPGH